MTRPVRSFLAAVALATAACAGTGDVPPPTVDASGLTVFGTADYDWTLRTLDGNFASLADYRGRVLFINLWASWCPPCIAELAGIERLRVSLADADVAFLLVSPEEAEPVNAFVRRHGYSLPFLIEGEPMPEAFDLRALPTTYIVDRTGRIVLRHRGAAEWDLPPVRDFLLRLAAS